MSLKTRFSLLLTLLASAFLCLGAVLWVKQTRDAIHEEIEAATRVAEQWLVVAAGEVEHGQRSPAALLDELRALGRLRANGLQVFDSQGREIYVAPPPSYKSGRTAPAWFADMVDPGFAPRPIAAGSYALLLSPDPSRSIIDAWDQLWPMTGWAFAFLSAIFFTLRRALERALAPLAALMAALRDTACGRFDTRLPRFEAAELQCLALAYNQMADNLQQTIAQNLRLEVDRNFDRRMEDRLQGERLNLSRELHDQLAQDITAICVLAGAIDQSLLPASPQHRHAAAIITAAQQMQASIRGILQRLRRAHCEDLDAALQDMLARWQAHYPHYRVAAEFRAGAVEGEMARAILRIVQEGLTNIVRHAQARSVQVDLWHEQGRLCLQLADDGRGMAAPSPLAGCGLGIAGMRERAAALGGNLQLEAREGGGARLRASFPIVPRQAQLAPVPTLHKEAA